MKGVVALSVFCEDIREEVKGTDTIVGVLPDNVAVPQIPFAFPKIAVYTRIMVAADYDPGPMALVLRHADGSEVPLAQVDPALVEEGKADARAQEKPFLGIVLRAAMGGLAVPAEGIVLAILREGDREHQCALLNVKLTPPAQAHDTATPLHPVASRPC
jgi:hypothetical protein